MSLAALLAAVALQTPGVVTSTPVVELLGLTPPEVAARLGAAPDPTADEALRIMDGGHLVEIHPIQRFWREPAMHGDLGVRPGETICLSGVLPPAPGEADGAPTFSRLAAGSRGQFVFVDGVLRSVHVTPRRPEGGPSPRDMRAAREHSRRRALNSPWAAAPGRLPLGDGGAAMMRLGPAAGPDAVMTSVCRPTPDAAEGSSAGDDWPLALAGAMVLLPVYVATQPFTAAENRRAEREGGALAAQLALGAELTQSPEEMVHGRRGVRVFRDRADPAFAVVAVKTGVRGSSAGLALAGVRDRRVVWTAGPAATGRLALSDALCLNDEGLLDDGRPGCSAYGYRP